MLRFQRRILKLSNLSITYDIFNVLTGIFRFSLKKFTYANMMDK